MTEQKPTEVPLWKGRLVAGGVGLVLSLVYLWQAVLLPFGTESRPGAAVFPVAVGLAFAVISVLTGVEALRAGRQSGTLSFPRGTELRKVVLVVVALVGLLVALPILGLLPSAALFSVLLLRALGATSWPRAVICGCVLGIGVYVVFVLVLEVSFPSLTGV